MTEGMDVVNQIAETDTDYSDRPLDEQKIKSMTVDTFGVDYPESQRSVDHSCSADRLIQSMFKKLSKKSLSPCICGMFIFQMQGLCSLFNGRNTFISPSTSEK